MEKSFDKSFTKVVVIGPSLKHKGGISSVLATYHNTMQGLRFRATNSDAGTLPGLFVLARTMLLLPFDRLSGRRIVHVHYATGKSWIRKSMLMRYAALLGFRIVAHCHGGTMQTYVERKGVKTFRKILSRAKVNVALTPYWQRFFRDVVQCPNVELVNNPIMEPVATETTKDSNIINFLFLGLIGDNKGIFDIMEAVAQLKAQGLKFRLTVGGNGEVERFCADIKRLDIEDMIDFRGWVTGTEKDKLLSTCQVLMLPSHAEGLPISILEAMAHGMAIIASPVGGIPEVVHDGENGIIVTPGDVPAIKAAMKAYIDNPSLAKKHGNAAQSLVRPYYASAVAERLAQIYNDVLK